MPPKLIVVVVLAIVGVVVRVVAGGVVVVIVAVGMIVWSGIETQPGLSKVLVVMRWPNCGYFHEI
jgi:hypothetical protein